MTEVERIADQMKRGYDGDAWHGTPLRKLLKAVRRTSSMTDGSIDFRSSLQERALLSFSSLPVGQSSQL